jgi:PAS domain S-box-containing protein
MLLIEPETGAIVDANVAASNYYGYSCDELRRLNLQDIKPLSQQATLDETRLAMNEKQNYFVVLHRLSSGEIRTVEVHISPVDMNDSILLFSIIHDITDRKNAEKKLLESEEKFRLAISTSPDAISIANFKDGLFVEINDAFCDLFGYTREEVLNSTSSELKLWSNPQDRSQLVGIVAEHGFCRNLEAIFSRKDGRLVTCLISAGLMEQNGVSQLILITRDITSRVLAFKEKQELQKQLFESQKMSALGTLVGGIAHDFNNMLQSIMGYSEILIMDKVPGSAGYRELETIIQTSRGGADLVKKLLAFAEQAPGYPTKIEVNHIISELKPLITHTLSSAINIETDLTENPTTILADPSHLEQIVMNVVINASEAMPNGGRVRIATRQKTLDEAYCKTHRGVKPGKYIRLSISDNGHGMDSETLARIFEPFFSTKQRGSLRGTGMGLSVVKGIAQQYGGHITCDSETGKGTAVRVYFPALDAPAPAPKSALSPKQKESSGFILLVEDNNLQARIESRFLESVGLRVIVAPTGEEALKIFEKQKDEISLVILDLILPGISGKDCLVEFIRMQPTVKVIVASGFTPDDQQSQELNPYIKGFLRKPFNAAQLIEKTMAALEND